MGKASPEPAPDPEATVLKVAVDCPLRSLLDYLPPPGMHPRDLPPGVRVRVPMGARSAVGVVVAAAAGSKLAPARLRRITARLDEAPLFDAALLDLLQWTASYYHHPPGEVYAAALPAALRAGLSAHPQETWISLTEAGRGAMAAGEPQRAARQRALLGHLAGTTAGRSASELDAVEPGWRSAARALV
ncbi:MAG: primosomal protein N', partial [Gammaproteobacteria bacterium]|nr:primosomal protein N' [Gammaproteobacteria bacterium]